MIDKLKIIFLLILNVLLLSLLFNKSFLIKGDDGLPGNGKTVQQPVVQKVEPPINGQQQEPPINGQPVVQKVEPPINGHQPTPNSYKEVNGYIDALVPLGEAGEIPGNTLKECMDIANRYGLRSGGHRNDKHSGTWRNSCYYYDKHDPTDGQVLLTPDMNKSACSDKDKKFPNCSGVYNVFGLYHQSVPVFHNIKIGADEDYTKCRAIAKEHGFPGFGVRLKNHYNPDFDIKDTCFLYQFTNYGRPRQNEQTYRSHIAGCADETKQWPNC